MNKEVLALAIRAHDGQTRKYSGLPYVVHPIEVAKKSVKYFSFWLDNCDFWEDNSYTLDEVESAAILHDTIEDCSILSLAVYYPSIYYGHYRNLDDLILKVAGKNVLTLVKELTNPSKNSKLSRKERKQMDRDHLKNISFEGKLIKMVDRMCNLRDMSGAPNDFKRLYVEESKLLRDAIGINYPVLWCDFNEVLEELENSIE